MYSKVSNIVIGFHGCDQSTFDEVIKNGERLKNSINDYDWLGHGQYFWERNYKRAYDWAVDQSKNLHSKIKTPAVIGAVIDLGHCLSLDESNSLKLLKRSYKVMEKYFKLFDLKMPVNKTGREGDDLLLRNLDCMVIEFLHDLNKKNNELEYDSTKGVFIEGDPVYDNSGIYEKTHVQICIRNPNCIKGYFSPRDIDPNFNNC